jgi:selenocysteine lyase/cysteine desulfurase
VLNRTVDAWRELEANPVRMSYGEGAIHVATDRVREQAARLLGCATDDVLITRSTTDAMNTIALGTRLTSGDRVLTTDQEHHGGSDCWRYLARRRGVIVDTVSISPSDHDAKVIVDRFASAITPSTRLISVSHILTSTGLRMPAAELAALARDRGILCVVDGAQALGQIAIDVKAVHCHAYATCGHKWLMAPKGTGLLYVSPDAADAIAPIQWQDTKRYVAGSTGIGSLPLVVGLGAAIEQANARGVPEIERTVLRLREYTIAQLKSIRDISVLSAPSGPLASALVAVLIPGRVDSQVLQVALRDKHNVMVKLVERQWFNGIRISPHIFNTEADIDRAVRALRTELT